MKLAIFKQTRQGHVIRSQSCVAIISLVPKQSSPQKGTPVPIKQLGPILCLLPLATTHQRSLSGLARSGHFVYIKHCVALCVWPRPRSIMLQGSSAASTAGLCSSLWLDESPVWMGRLCSPFIRDGRLGCFPLCGEGCAVNIHVRGLIGGTVFPRK